MRGRTGLAYDVASTTAAAARCVREQISMLDRSLALDEVLLFTLCGVFVWHYLRHIDRRNRLRDVFETVSHFHRLHADLKKTRQILEEKRLNELKQVIEQSSDIKVACSALMETMPSLEILSDVRSEEKSEPVEIAPDDEQVLNDLESELEKIEQLEMIHVDVEVTLDEQDGLDEGDIDRIKQQQNQVEEDKLREEQLAVIEAAMLEKLKVAEGLETAAARELLGRCGDFVGAIGDQKMGLQAIRMRDIDQLKDIVKEIDRKGLIIHLLAKYPDSAIAKQLARDLENLRGRCLLMIAKFEDIVRMREEIENMNQSTIAEIRSFSDPPEFVRNVMASLYTLLGEDRKDVKDWTKIRVLLGKIGKKSLRRRIVEFDLTSLEGRHALIKRAKILLKDHTLAEVKEVSIGASIFFSWCMVTIDTVETSF